MFPLYRGLLVIDHTILHNCNPHFGTNRRARQWIASPLCSCSQCNEKGNRMILAFEKHLKLPGKSFLAELVARLKTGPPKKSTSASGQLNQDRVQTLLRLLFDQGHLEMNNRKTCIITGRKLCQGIFKLSHASHACSRQLLIFGTCMP